jgi:hypothetical protein
MQKKQSIMTQAAILLLKIYKQIISPWIPQACIYTPTCSEYARQAFQKHGFFYGNILAVNRLLRCFGLLFNGGKDLVPEKFSWKVLFQRYKNFWRWSAKDQS